MSAMSVPKAMRAATVGRWQYRCSVDSVSVSSVSSPLYLLDSRLQVMKPRRTTLSEE